MLDPYLYGSAAVLRPLRYAALAGSAAAIAAALALFYRADRIERDGRPKAP